MTQVFIETAQQIVLGNKNPEVEFLTQDQIEVLDLIAEEQQKEWEKNFDQMAKDMAPKEEQYV